MITKLRTGVFSTLVCAIALNCATAESPPSDNAARPIRIGAVAYAPSAVTIFNGLTRYLSKNGLSSDYVLYSNYDSLVEALERNEIDIAWNTPLAHAQYHVRNQCHSQTLVMRDVDRNISATLVVRLDSDIKSLADLAGKRLVLGSLQAAEATVLPIHFLNKEGLDMSKVAVVSLDAEVDSKGNPCASPEYVLQAVRDGRGDAGIITTGLWNREKDKPATQGTLRPVWTSPTFSHCVFTAAEGFDKDRAETFVKLMTQMDPKDSATVDVMRLEGTRKWLPSSPDGFKDLVDALSKK